MIYVFTGPTLGAQEAARELDAVFLPPAAQGDLYRTALDRPEAIGLIDGYFDDVPAVWHKELLWAMSEGIHVFGASSMGALRAAELAPFGMQGVGAIFEAFQGGELEDDDEVAIAHASAEDGFRSLSEALVNIRATLKGAERAGVISAPAHTTLVRLAKALHYPERSWPALFAQAPREGVPPDELRGLREWLPRGRVDQKRADALALLHALRDHQTARPGPKQVTYAFAHTDAWADACQSAGRLPTGAPARETLASEALLEELRVSGLLPRVRAGALARALALEEARRQADTVDAEGLRRTCEAFRREKDLLTLRQFEHWVAEQRLEAPVRFFEDEARVRRIEALLEPEVLRCLPDHLRARGLYGALMERLEDKERVLARAGLERPGLDEAGLTDNALWEWYFTERLGRSIPTDLERFSNEAGFAHVDALRRAALREYCYLREAGSLASD
ncbi:hypothetical protein JYK02_08565 [Corallococcus macrosporus]|uniref:TfuA-like core domain-containing protein n=1 Tax=Corallococcus macrosporus TaxID=35 RepID=A0ABS3D7B0_9BACT|nr:TfuA-like protein [Corallococcus macrosporus]MBN8227558.1 hypothetical protein [Corallococcus macrosporus]